MATSTEEDQILWVKFEKWDINGEDRLEDFDAARLPSLIVLGYNKGIRIWLREDDKTQLVFSLWKGPIKVARLLPTPNQIQDGYNSHRPILALCNKSSANKSFDSITFIAMKTGNTVRDELFLSEVDDIKCDEMIIAVALTDQIVGMNTCTLKKTFVIKSYPNLLSYPSTRPYPNPVALKNSWLAYADEKLYPSCQSRGGIVDVGQSYTGMTVKAAEAFAEGLRYFFKSSTIMSSLTGEKSSEPKTHVDPALHSQPGIVTIINYSAAAYYHGFNISEIEIPINLLDASHLIVAHFPAYDRELVAALAFDPLMNLVTVSRSGHSFNVVKITSNSNGENEVHHLCVLLRGDTEGTVQDITFSSYAHWTAVSTIKGTTHVYFTTHNIEMFSEESIDQDSYPEPVTTQGMVYLKCKTELIEPVLRIKQPVQHAYNIAEKSGATELNRFNKTAFGYERLCVAAEFSPARRDPGSLQLKCDEELEKISIFVIDCYGNLLEYVLTVKSRSKGSRQPAVAMEIIEEKSISLWGPFPNENKPPLADDNPLITYQEAKLDPMYTDNKAFNTFRKSIEKIKTQQKIEKGIVEAMEESSSTPSSSGNKGQTAAKSSEDFEEISIIEQPLSLSDLDFSSEELHDSIVIPSCVESEDIPANDNSSKTAEK